MNPVNSVSDSLLKQVNDLKFALEFYKVIADNSNSVEIMCNSEGRITYVSNAFETITGYKSDDFLCGKVKFLDIVHPEDVKNFGENIYNAVFTNPEKFLEFRIVRSDKAIKFLNLSSKSVYSTYIYSGIHTTLSDVTEAKERAILNERTIKELTDNYQSFFNNIDDFLFVLDLHGTIIQVNETVINRLGYASNELIHQPILMVHPPERREEAGQIVSDMLHGIAESCPIPLQTKSGLLIPVETKVKFGIWNNRQVIYGVTKDISKLKFSEEKFSKVFYLNPSACSLSNIETSEIVEVNQAFTSLLGYTKDEVLGRSAIQLQIMTLRDREYLLANADSSGHAYNLEIKLKAKNGAYKITLLSAENIWIQNVQYRYTVAHDITELVKAKEKAEESEQMLNEAQKLSHIGNWKYNTMDNSLYWSDEVFQIFEKDKANFSATPEIFLSLVHPDDLPEVQKAYNLHLETKDPFKIIHRILVPNGRIKYVNEQGRSVFDDNGKTLWSIGTVADITLQVLNEMELKAAKEKAEKSEIRLRTLINTIPDVIWLKDINGKYLICNNRFEEFLGAKEHEIVGKTDYDFLDKSLSDFFKEKDQAAMQASKPSINEEEITFASDGHKEFLETINSPLLDADNNIIGVLGIGRDITKRKLDERDLIHAKEKIEESDRLKTAFLHNMSHEIRTPMNAIIGFADLLSNSDLSAEKRNNYASIIQNSSHQLLAIVTDILTISALETNQEKVHITAVSINDILVELLTIFKQMASNQNLQLFTSPGINNKQSEIYTDKTKLTQILTNLITNALKFTAEGFIEFGYSLNDTDNSAELYFYVKDTGIGIKPEFHQVIFERFRQADKSITKLYGGTGLGLAISKAFVQLLGGKIGLHSEYGKGSVFYFTIPYNPVNSSSVMVPSAMRSAVNFTLLIAEDEEYNFLFMKEILCNYNLTILHAKNGSEAVDMVKQHKFVDVILMDIKMPVLNGLEATKIIKELYPHIPVIAQTAYALEFEQAKYSLIFDSYLTKPLIINDLISVLNKYITLN